MRTNSIRQDIRPQSLPESTMKQIIQFTTLIASVLLGFGSIYAQSISVYNVNASAFPTITADYAAFDSQGQPDTGLTASHFRVSERADGGNFVDVTPTLTHDCDRQTKDPEASIILILDRSGSMMDNVNGQQRFQYAKDAINAFVREINFTGQTRVCLVVFSGNYEVKVDWTNDPKIISDTLLKLQAVGPTNYEISFASPGNNIYEKFKERPANIAKYAFFLTDGHPNPGMEDPYTWVDTNIVDLQAQGIRFYSITLLEKSTHWTLESLARNTGGKSVVTTEEELVSLMSLLALETQVTEVCKLTWTAPYGCHPDDRNRTATITLLKGSSPTQTVTYVAPPSSVAAVEISDPVLFCGDPPANQPAIALVTITARNAPLRVTGQSINPNTYFTVLDWNHPYGRSFSPFTLPVDSTRTLRVQFTQGAQRIYRQAELRMEGSPCPPIIDLVGGQGVVKISSPNGGELFSTCDTVTITWSGVLPTQPITLQYSSDNGNTWNTITSAATGLSYKWLPPNAGGAFKIKAIVAQIDQYQWGVGTGGTGTETATSVAINKNDLDVYSTGYFDGPAKFGSTVVSNAIGNIDGFLIKWTADGNIAKVTILKGTGSNDDRIMGVATDTLGNYYVVGYFTSPSIQFGTQTRPIGTGDGSNMFIYAFDANDNVLWSAFGTGNGLNTTVATGMDVGVRYNAAGRPEVIVSGTFQRFIRVGPRSSGGWVESNRYTNNANRNYYAVYDELGYAQLYENAVPPATVKMKSLKATDSKGFEYETGNYIGAKTVTPPTITIAGFGGQDVFLTKFGSIPPSEDESDDIFIVKSPQLSFTLPTATMDPTAQGQTSLKSFNGILCNTGDFPVVIRTSSFAGPHPTEFNLVSNIDGSRLEPGECISIEVEFTPAGMGMRTAQLIVEGDCGAPAAILVEGEGLAPCWNEVEPQINLGKIPMGQSPTTVLPCVLKNTGLTNLSGVLTKAGSGDIIITAGAGPFNLAQGACHDITVQVNAVTPGPISITVDYGLGKDCGFPVTIITAEVVQPNVSISSVDFGRKRIGTTSNDIIQITNLNADPVTITAISVSDPASPDLQLVLPTPAFTLAPTETRDIPVTYTPTTRGAHVVTVTASVQGQAQPIQGEARGFGFLPAIAAQGYTFAAWTVGQQSPETGKVVITNTEAESDLQIFDIRFASPTADFAWVNALPGFPQTLAPGGTLTLDVLFTPQAAGNRIVNVIIEHDALPGDVPPYTDTAVIVQGVGAEPSEIPPIDFGNVLTCASKTTTVTVINPNPTSALNCGAPIGTGDVGAFSLDITAPFVVPPSGSQVVTVTFVPQGTGFASASFEIPNDQGLSITINASGSGVTTTADFTFGNVVSGIVGQSIRTPINVTTGFLDTVIVSEVVLTFTHSPDYIAFRQFSTPEQGGWTFTQSSPVRGTTIVTAVPDPGVQLANGPFVTPEFDVYLTADATQPVSFTASVTPSCVVASGDADDINVELVCYAEGRLVKIGEAPFTMSDVTPNPAGNVISVPYSTGIECVTTFELVDAVGNVVASKQTDVQKSGQYAVEINVADVSNGLYFLRMVSGPFVATQQVMVVK